MKKIAPWLFLIPVLALLAGLPSQLHGHVYYKISNVNYVLSIFGWLFIFCGVFALNRGSESFRIFFSAVGLIMIASIGYKLWIGQRGWIDLIFDLVVLWIAIAMVRTGISSGHDDADDDDDSSIEE
jgi:hypothetical protein